MPMVMPQILKSVDFTKPQKSTSLENKTFFLQIKKFVNYKPRATYFITKNSFVAEVTFKAKPFTFHHLLHFFFNFLY